ncbi:ribonuclease H-like domain-containing protein [Tanacetum coccineum]
MVQKLVLNNVKKGTGQREVKQVWNNAMRVNHQNFSNTRRDFALTSVLTKSDIVPISAARQSSSRAAAPASAARPINTAASKPFVNVARPRPNAFHKSHSPSKIPFNQQTALKNTNLNNKFNIAKINSVNTAKRNKVTSAIGEQGINVDNPQYALQHKGIFDSGCSRHLTGNKSFLTDYRDINGGFVTFVGSPKGGKITGKGKIRNGKLDFEDVYFMKELKFNLFSVSQMCDKKNNILFTETECLILSPNFKLLDENPLGKFDEKSDEGFFVRYSINNKAFRVFNTRTRKVEENLYITFLENKPNAAGSGPDWLFDIDLLTNSMNYEPVTTGNQTNRIAGIKEYILLPLLYDSPQSSKDAVVGDAGKKITEEPANEGQRNGQEKEEGASNKEGYASRTNKDSTVSPSVSAVGQSFTNAYDLPTDPLMPDLEDTADLLNTGIFSGAYDDEYKDAEDDLNNLETTMNVSPILTTKIHKDHPKNQIIGDINSATQTRRMTEISKEHAMVS